MNCPKKKSATVAFMTNVFEMNLFAFKEKDLFERTCNLEGEKKVDKFYCSLRKCSQAL